MKKLFLFPITLICLIFTINIVYATPQSNTPEEVSKYNANVVQVLLICTDDAGNSYYIHKGTGTVIGYNSNSQYIITDKSILSSTEEELTQIRNWNAIDSSRTLNEQYFILIEPDIFIHATEVTRGTDYPYLILSPEQSVKISAYPVLSSINEAVKNSNVYMSAYNSDMNILGATGISPESLSTLYGTLTERSVENNSISCDIVAQTGAAGSPLFNEDGKIIGIFYNDASGNLSLMTSDIIMSVLKQFDIQYKSGDANIFNVPDEKTMQELNDLLLECEKDITENADKYSDSSLATYRAAITAAIDVLQSDQQRLDSYINALETLKTAKKKLRPKYFVLYIIETILLTAILILGLINVKQLFKSKKINAILHSPKNSGLTGAYIVRLDNNEQIYINKKLRIGKNAQSVDYCIDDSTISRHHATIYLQKNIYYVIDNNSTNHTTVNGIILQPNQPYKLMDSDIIQLSGTKFRFMN